MRITLIIRYINLFFLLLVVLLLLLSLLLFGWWTAISLRAIHDPMAL